MKRAMPTMFWPETDPDFQHIGDLKAAVENGSACAECGESWDSHHKKPPVICTVCANKYLQQLLDALGYTLRKDRGVNSEGHARLARQKRAATQERENVDSES